MRPWSGFRLTMTDKNRDAPHRGQKRATDWRPNGFRHGASGTVLFAHFPNDPPRQAESRSNTPWRPGPLLIPKRPIGTCMGSVEFAAGALIREHRIRRVDHETDRLVVVIRLRSEMSLRHQAPFQRIHLTAVYACSLAAEIVLPNAVIPSTRPPLVTT